MDPYTSAILLLILLMVYFCWYTKKAYSFFERRGIPFIKPTFPFGNIPEVILLRKSIAEGCADLYEKLEPHGLAGIFAGLKPMILIRDPQLMKDILIKDFTNFSDRGWTVDKTMEPLSNHIFTMQVDDWRNLRPKLTRAFSTGKLKMMFPLVNTCAIKLGDVIDQSYYDQSFDVKDLAARYTIDVVGSCVFGLEINSLDDPDAEFKHMGEKLFRARLRSLLRTLEFSLPRLLNKFLEISFFDLKMQDYFGNIVYKIMDHRERTKEKRNDLLDLLIALKKEETNDKYNDIDEEKDKRKFFYKNGYTTTKKGETDFKITDQLLAAQAFIFFVAGFEPSSTNFSYILLELSQNKSIQDKIRKEIQDVIAADKGQITYEGLKRMTYTDLVIQETLRKYPPLAVVQRRTMRDYKVANSEIIIPSGTSIVISVLGLHRDEKYYDNPEEFRPERFTQDEIAKRPNYTYMPFGGGPRYCIGGRFAKLTVKVGLIYALQNYSYRISPQMKFPLEFDKNFGLLTPNSSILLQRERIK